MIIDTHLHVIDRTALHYPWLAGVPALDRDFPYETYRREAERVGIAQALHMEVDVDPADIDAETRYVAGLEKRPESLIVGAIAGLPAGRSRLRRHARRGQRPIRLVKGLRRVLHVDAGRADRGAGLPRQHRAGSPAAGSPSTLRAAAPDRQGGGARRSGARRDLRARSLRRSRHPGGRCIPARAIADIARRPNVTGKISGVVAYADPADWTVATLRPYVEHTIESFGWDRVVWGSDWPVCTLGGGLSAWVAATHALLEGVSADERAALLSGNAKRLWRL